MRKSGISLIVLVITIVVIIILTSAIVLNISSNNPINKANEAVFKTNIKSVQEELSLYISSNIQGDGTYTYPTKSQITSANKYNSDVLNFVKEKVVYRTSDINEKNQLESMGVVVDYTYGLVFNYKMNGTSIDSISGNQATVSGALLTDDRFAKSNNAYNFDGIDDNIDCGNGSNLNLTDNYTISAWVNIQNTSVGYHHILSKGQSGSTYLMQYALAINGDKPRFVFGDGNTTTNGIQGASMSINTWYHIVAALTPTQLKLWVNGVPATPISRTINPIVNTKKVILGTNGAGGETLQGKLDDVRIYNRVLDDQEVSNLYNIYWAE